MTKKGGQSTRIEINSRYAHDCLLKKYFTRIRAKLRTYPKIPKAVSLRGRLTTEFKLYTFMYLQIVIKLRKGFQILNSFQVIYEPFALRILHV